jgi:hypothetical protein
MEIEAMPLSDQKLILVQCQVPEPVALALKEAAKREFTTRTGYVRKVLVDHLTAEGLDPRSPLRPAEGRAA